MVEHHSSRCAGSAGTRRAMLMACAAACMAGWTESRRAWASSPHRMLVGFPAGGNVDVVARRLGDFMRAQAQQTWLVENRPGAGGRLAIESLKSARPDGATWLLTPGSMVTIYPHVYSHLRYAPLRDMQPVALVCRVPIAFAVGPAVPASVQDVAGYLHWVREGNAARASVASPAAGAVTHFLTYLLGRSGGLHLEHVAYKGSAPGLQDVVGGHIPAMMSPLGDMLQHAAARRLRILATSGERRSGFVPAVPTFAEQGHATVAASEWFGLFAPADTAPQTVRQVAELVQRALASPDIAGAFMQMGYEAAPEDATTAAFAQRIGSETRAWATVVRTAGFKLDD